MNRSIRFQLIAVLIFSLPATTVFSQQKSANTQPGSQTAIAQSASDIAAIRAAYSNINQLPLKGQDFKFESPGCVDGGLITYMKRDDEILKITNSGSIGDGSWKTEFYFSAGKLIFYFDTVTGGAAAEKAPTTEYRLYVRNDKPIRCMEGKKIIPPDSKANKSIQTAYKLLKAYKTRNFAAALCDE
ncbi:MAG: hypothetical protein ACXVJD_08895 [Mucilaginibacter sp.]